MRAETKIRLLRAIWIPLNRAQKWLAKQIIRTAWADANTRWLNDQLVGEQCR